MSGFGFDIDQPIDQENFQSFPMSDEEFKQFVDDFDKEMATAGFLAKSPSEPQTVDNGNGRPAFHTAADHFWESVVTHTLVDGRVVKGTVRELFDTFPELKTEIGDAYNAITAQPAASVSNAPVHADSVARYVGDPEVVDQEYVPPKDASPSTEMKTTMQTQTPTPPKNRGAAPKIKQEFVPGPVPKYIADVQDADDARHQLANPDYSDYTPVLVSNDDVHTVRARLHSYASKIYDAISAEGIQEPRVRMDRVRESRVADKLLARFQTQQAEKLHGITALLQSPQQLKNARCRCVLAVEAAIFVHEVGVPNELAERAHGKHMTTKERYTQVDKTLACSERLEKMIQMSQEYKLVALDILTGKNLPAIAHNPTGYARNKISYLTSNLLRQNRLEVTAAKEKGENGEQAKKSRKRGARIVEAADSEAEEPATKR